MGSSQIGDFFNDKRTDPQLEAQCSFLSNLNLGYYTSLHESLEMYRPRTRKQHRDYSRRKETKKTIEACTDNFTISALAVVSPEPENPKLAFSKERRSSSPQHTVAVEERTSHEDLNENVKRYPGNAPKRSDLTFGPWNDEDADKANSDGDCNLNESISPENCNKDEVVLSQLQTLTKCLEEGKGTSVSPNIEHVSETCLANVFTSLSQRLNAQEKAKRSGLRIRIRSKKRVAKKLFPPNLSEKSKMRKHRINDAVLNLHALPRNISSSPPHSPKETISSPENHAPFEDVKNSEEVIGVTSNPPPRRRSHCALSFSCDQCPAQFHLKCNLQTHLITHSYFSLGLFSTV